MVYFIGILNLKIFYSVKTMLNLLILDHVEEYILNSHIQNTFQLDGTEHQNVSLLTDTMDTKWTFGVLDVFYLKSFHFFHCFPVMMKLIKFIKFIIFVVHLIKHF